MSACEVLVTKKQVFIAGEVNSHAHVDVIQTAKDIIKKQVMIP